MWSRNHVSRAICLSVYSALLSDSLTPVPAPLPSILPYLSIFSLLDLFGLSTLPFWHTSLNVQSPDFSIILHSKEDIIKWEEQIKETKNTCQILSRISPILEVSVYGPHQHPLSTVTKLNTLSLNVIIKFLIRVHIAHTTLIIVVDCDTSTALQYSSFHTAIHRCFVVRCRPVPGYQLHAHTCSSPYTPKHNVMSSVLAKKMPNTCVCRATKRCTIKLPPSSPTAHSSRRTKLFVSITFQAKLPFFSRIEAEGHCCRKTFSRLTCSLIVYCFVLRKHNMLTNLPSALKTQIQHVFV